MSLASTYSTAISSAQAQAPASFTGPGGLLTASVNEDGTCLLTVTGIKFVAPAQAMIDFATWVNATFA